MNRPRKIISGGQTGVDRAALDVAIDLGIEHGGWCPAGRLAEDGTIPLRYQLTEHESPAYADRTRQNVIDSDGTLVLYSRRLQGGTSLTTRYAREANKPLFLVRLDKPPLPSLIHQWLDENFILTLNVAGPRASSAATIYQDAFDFLLQVFSR